jgi:hypothetical protein
VISRYDLVNNAYHLAFTPGEASTAAVAIMGGLQPLPRELPAGDRGTFPITAGVLAVYGADEVRIADSFGDVFLARDGKALLGEHQWGWFDGAATPRGLFASQEYLKALTIGLPPVGSLPPRAPNAPIEEVRPESAKWHKTAVRDLAKQLEQGTYQNEKGGKQSKLAVRMDLLPMEALLSVGRVLDHGSKYGEENWHKTTVAENINHALMHLARFRAGEVGEPNLSHAACRILFALWLQIRDTGKLEV